MGDKAILAKATQELEDLYLGVPDDSVDLTFKDFASFQQNDVAERKTNNMEPIHDVAERKTNNMEPIHEDPREGTKNSDSFGKSSSLDFSKALQGTKDHNRRRDLEDELYREHAARNSVKRDNGSGLRPGTAADNLMYDDVSGFSTAAPFEERGGRRRPGIPHSKICALCSVYIYIFRHRCLVCGRVYCRHCVSIGMGEMTEGRKCVECLGRRFSQRYIRRAGRTGCCWRYPNAVKQQELIWAEKGPRSRFGRSTIEPRSRSIAMMPGTPSRSHVMPGTPSRSHVMAGTPNRSHVMLGTPKSPTSFAQSTPFSPHSLPL